ncbi:MAG TPA: BTAD domain-containing putative transcriptional regulator [Pseudonocardiaceae bacterium]
MLGPLIIRAEHHDTPGISVPAGRQRVILATLLARANRVVSVAELAEFLWQDDQPSTASVTVRNYVKRLRDTLPTEIGARIVTRDQGYEIAVGEDELDLLRFTRCYADAEAAVRTDAWQRAAELLDDGLPLWRGEPLSDVPSESLRRDDVPHLHEMYLQAWEWRADAAIRLGRPSDVIGDLRRLVREHPLRERFHALLMLAFHNTGSRGDAIRAYHVVRDMLVDELGVEPGWELQDLYRRVLGANTRADEDPAPSTRATVVARQLPAGIPHFVGREAELQRLSGLLDQADTPGTVTIAAIDGMAGIGKTALALRWAHRLADRFPDGQLYVNLRGFDPTGRPVAPAEAIRELLDALQVSPERVPNSVYAQASLYRSLLAGTRTLVVLDNARDVEQVRPLLPGAASCLVLVTSRNQLTGLVALEGAHPLTLDVLTDDEAGELLSRRLGTDRTAGEPQATTQLIELCAHLPLALSIAAARAATQPMSLTRLTDGLRDQRTRLDVLDAGDLASSARAVFSWSYDNLSEPAATLFRLLGVHPGPDISVPAAASLAAIPVRTAREALAELCRGRLLTERVPGRYSLHDLLRSYAMEQASEYDSVAERRGALHRVLDHYLYAANTAALRLEPSRRALTLPDPPAGIAIVELDDYPAAFAWLDDESPVLVAIAQQAAGEFDTHVWQIVWLLKDFLTRRGYRPEWIEMHHMALRAAQRLGDVAGQVLSLRTLANLHGAMDDFGKAAAYNAQALELHDQLDDPMDKGRTHLTMSWAMDGIGDYAGALEHTWHAYRLFGDHPELLARALNNMAWIETKLDRAADALDHAQQALTLQRKTGERYYEALILDTIGHAHEGLGNHQAAIDSYLHSIAVHQEVGSEGYNRAVALVALGDVHQRLGDTTAADEAWRAALATLEELQHPEAGAVRERLRASRAARRTP